MKWPVLFLFLPAATMHEWLWPGPLVRTVFRYEALQVLRRVGVQPQLQRRAISLSAVVQYWQVCISLAHRNGQKQCHGMVEINDRLPLVTFFVPSTGKPCATGRRWGRLDCCPQGALDLRQFPRTAFTNCHKLRGLHSTTIWSYRCAGQKPDGGFYQANTEVFSGPCSFLETWGKNPFPAHAWCWQNPVSFFFYFDCDIIDIR